MSDLSSNTVSNSSFWSMFRSMRNGDLMACDWTQLPDAKLSEEDKLAWTEYRQKLRDLPNNVTDPYPYVSIPKPNWLWPCQPGQTPIPEPEPVPPIDISQSS
jgi:hypothetical protein